MEGNTISNFTLTHTTTGQSLNFLQESSLRVLNDFVKDYNVYTEMFQVTDGMIYSDSDIMNRVVIQCSAQVDVNNDVSVKTLINTPGYFSLDITVNGVDYFAYVKIGNQSSALNEHIFKVYQFDLEFMTVFFQKNVIVDMISENIATSTPLPTTKATGTAAYDSGQYGVDTYDSLGLSSNLQIFTIQNTTGQNLYIELDYYCDNSNNPVTLVSNLTQVELAGTNSTNLVQYCNIPSLTYIKEAGQMNPSILPINNQNNFLWDFTGPSTPFNISNVSAVSLTTYTVSKFI